MFKRADAHAPWSGDCSLNWFREDIRKNPAESEREGD